MAGITQALARILGGEAVIGRSGRMLRLVVAVGMLSGLAAAVFVAALNLLGGVLGPEHHSAGTQLLVLVGVGAAIGLLTTVLGNPGDVELLVDNIHVSGGRADIRDLRALLPVSLLGIAAGSAVGPEAPLVQTTGSLGSWVALRLGLSQDDLRLLTISGMAAGFTVLLGAPIGSAIFALEILHRRGLEYYEALLPALLGSVTGYAVFAAITGLGLEPFLSFPEPHRFGVADLGVGLLAGVVGAALATVFTYLAHYLRKGFRRLPPGGRPVAGGLALGLLGLITPFALTFGEHQINEIVVADLTIPTLVLAGSVKLLAAAMIVTAGWRGGFIIPLFFVGVTFGLAGARQLGLDPVVAMTALMAATNVGVTKTPIGSAIVVSEIAGLRLLPSTLLASLVALVLTSRSNMIHTQRRREGEFAVAASDATDGVGRALLGFGDDQGADESGADLQDHVKVHP